MLIIYKDKAIMSVSQILEIKPMLIIEIPHIDFYQTEFRPGFKIMKIKIVERATPYVKNYITSESYENGKIEITDKETSAEVIQYDKQDFKQVNKQNVYQFEKIFLELGTDVLSNIDNYLAVNPKESVKELRRDIQNVIKQIQSSNDLEVLNKLKYQLRRIEDMGGFDKLVPSEGIVFIYKGKTYKLTGLFAAVNQLLGLTKYV